MGHATTILRQVTRAQGVPDLRLADHATRATVIEKFHDALGEPRIPGGCVSDKLLSAAATKPVLGRRGPCAAPGCFREAQAGHLYCDGCERDGVRVPMPTDAEIARMHIESDDAPETPIAEAAAERIDAGGPVVSLGQGDYRRDITGADILGVGIDVEARR